MSNLDKFKETMKTLRSENGCPWDKEQTLETLKQYLIEESYEVIDAIDKNDVAEHKEELGDVLLQILFQSQIRSENGEFDVEDVIEYANNKIISRHPHVFKKDETIKTADDVVNKWNSFKEKEGKKITFFGNIPNSFPALLESLKINKKAAKTGFDWEKIEDIFDKLDEEVQEFKEAKTKEEQEMELGDILFTIVNLARRYDINPEDALKKSDKKFKERFDSILQLAKDKNLEFEKLSLAQMDELWDEVKRKKKK